MSNRMVICMGSSCFARGNRENLERIEAFLSEHGIAAELDLVGSRCENLCAEGPVIEWNGARRQHMSPERLGPFLEEVLGDAREGGCR